MGLHQLFEGGMQKKSHSSLHCCGLPCVLQSRSPSLSVKVRIITQHTSGAADQIQTSSSRDDEGNHWSVCDGKKTCHRGKKSGGSKDVTMAEFHEKLKLALLKYNNNNNGASVHA